MKMKLNKKAMAVCGIAVLLAGAVVFWHPWSSAAKEKASEDGSTTTAQATVMTIENTLSSDGEVQGSLEENVSPHTGYYLDEVKVSAGDALEEGDVILTYTNGKKMKAPYNCVVEEWSLPEEEEQLTTDHYVKVAGTDVLQMELSVDEDEVSLLKAGNEAQVTVSAVGSTCDGVITSVSQVGDYTSSGATFTAEVTFENDGNIKLGMSGTATITLEKAENALCVPVDAVHTSGNQSFVTVQNGKETSEAQVTTGIKNDAYIQITDGLSEGDTVVVPVSESNDSRDGFDGMPGGGDMGGPGGSGGDMPGGRPD